MKRAASSAAVESADDEYFTPWCSSKRDFRPRRICTVCSTEGSFTSTFWKRRRQRMVLLEHAAEFRERGRADALQLAVRQGRLEQVRGVERAARGRTGADDRVDLVDEQDAVRRVLQLLQHGLQALLEVAAVLGAGQQRAHVQRIHDGILQDVGHVFLDDAPCQAFGDRGLADAGLAHQQRVVLAAAAQDLDHAVDFFLAADQRIDVAVGSRLVQVLRELVQRAFLGLAFDLRFFHAFRRLAGCRSAGPCARRAR